MPDAAASNEASADVSAQAPAQEGGESAQETGNPSAPAAASPVSPAASAPDAEVSAPPAASVTAPPASVPAEPAYEAAPEAVEPAAELMDAFAIPPEDPEENAAGPDESLSVETVQTDKEKRDAQKLARLVEQVSETPEALESIRFPDVEQRVREHSLAALVIAENIASLRSMDFAQTEQDLREKLNAMSRQMDGLERGLAAPGLDLSGPNLDAISQKLQEALGGVAAQSSARSALSNLESAYNTAYSAFEDIVDGTTQQNTADLIRSLENGEDSVVLGTESLYIALISLTNTKAQYERQLTALNRQVEAMELMYKQGRVSALDLNNLKAARTALSSGLETINMNLRTNKGRLENLLGAAITGDIRLGALPAVTEKQLSAMDVEADFQTAKAKSYELYSAGKTLQDAQEAYEEKAGVGRYSDNRSTYLTALHTWEAAKNTYNDTLQSYELRFRILFEQVHNDYQVWAASKEALQTEQANYQVKELQYRQGNLSRNDLLDARDTLTEKEEAVTSAANTLFSDYNSYRWAVEHGILLSAS